MNHQSSKSVLYILLGISGLIIALAVGYYYGVALPGIEKAKLEFQIEADQAKIIQQQKEAESKATQQEQAKTQEYRVQCKKGYQGITAQYVSAVNGACGNSMTQACVQKFDDDYPMLVPDEINQFIANCISRKKQGLSTFDDTMK